MINTTCGFVEMNDLIFVKMELEEIWMVFYFLS